MALPVVVFGLLVLPGGVVGQGLPAGLAGKLNCTFDDLREWFEVVEGGEVTSGNAWACYYQHYLDGGGEPDSLLEKAEPKYQIALYRGYLRSLRERITQRNIAQINYQRAAHAGRGLLRRMKPCCEWPEEDSKYPGLFREAEQDINILVQHAGVRPHNKTWLALSRFYLTIDCEQAWGDNSIQISGSTKDVVVELGSHLKFSGHQDIASELGKKTCLHSS